MDETKYINLPPQRPPDCACTQSRSLLLSALYNQSCADSKWQVHLSEEKYSPFCTSVALSEFLCNSIPFSFFLDFLSAVRENVEQLSLAYSENTVTDVDTRFALQNVVENFPEAAFPRLLRLELPSYFVSIGSTFLRKSPQLEKLTVAGDSIGDGTEFATAVFTHPRLSVLNAENVILFSAETVLCTSANGHHQSSDGDVQGSRCLAPHVQRQSRSILGLLSKSRLCHLSVSVTEGNERPLSAAVGQLSELRSLHLTLKGTNSFRLYHMSLQELKCETTGATLPDISCHNLRSLTVRGGAVSDVFLRQVLEQSPKLTEFRCSLLPTETDRLRRALCPHFALTRLELEAPIPASALRLLVHAFPVLEHLSVTGLLPPLTDTDISCTLSACHQLHSLCLVVGDGQPQETAVQGTCSCHWVLHSASAPRLSIRHLRLCGASVSDAFLSALFVAGSERLETLWLERCDGVTAGSINMVLANRPVPAAAVIACTQGREAAIQAECEELSLNDTVPQPVPAAGDARPPSPGLLADNAAPGETALRRIVVRRCPKVGVDLLAGLILSPSSQLAQISTDIPLTTIQEQWLRQRHGFSEIQLEPCGSEAFAWPPPD